MCVHAFMNECMCDCMHVCMCEFCVCVCVPCAFILKVSPVMLAVHNLMNVSWFAYVQYGEERLHRVIAKAIVREREKCSFSTTHQLAAVVEQAVGWQRRRRLK